MSENGMSEKDEPNLFFTTCTRAEFTTSKGWYCVDGKKCSKTCYKRSPVKGIADLDTLQITTRPF